MNAAAKQQIKEDVNDYKNIKNYLMQLQDPYNFLDFKSE